MVTFLFRFSSYVNFPFLQTRPIPDAISPDFLPSPPQNPSIITPRIKKARKQRPHNPNEIQPIVSPTLSIFTIS